MHNNTSYNQVTNKPIPCTFCSNTVQGRVLTIKENSKDINLCKWICGRCGNLIKMGQIK